MQRKILSLVNLFNWNIEPLQLSFEDEFLAIIALENTSFC